MAGLQMPKKGQGLQSLRDLKDQERETDGEAPSPEMTDFRRSVLTEGLTEARTDGKTDERTEGRPSASQEGQTAINPSVSEAALTAVHLAAQPSSGTAVPPDGLTDAIPPRRAPRLAKIEPEPEPITDENFAEIVRQAIAAKRVLTGGNKTTVDMTPELAKRAAIYSLDHGKVSARQMFVELLDAFLTLEGY
jgi:hypothetical protein